MADIKARHQRAGYLNKLPMSRPNSERWQRRFFVAKDGFLLYYSSGNVSAKYFDTKPKGIIPLGNCKVELVARGPKKGEINHGIKITHPDFLPGRALVLHAADAKDQQEWAEALRKCSTVTMENALVGEARIEQLRAAGTAMEKEKEELLKQATDAALRLKEETEEKLRLLTLHEENAVHAKEAEERMQQREHEMAAAMAKVEEKRRELEQQAAKLQEALAGKTLALAETENEYNKIQDAINSSGSTGAVDILETFYAKARALQEEKLRLERERDSLEKSMKDMSQTTQRLQTTLASTEAAKRQLESQMHQLYAEEGELDKERRMRRALERKLLIAEDSLRRLDAALRKHGIKLDIDVYADVKTLMNFFEERVEEARRDAKRIEIMKNALHAKRQYLTASAEIHNTLDVKQPENNLYAEELEDAIAPVQEIKAADVTPASVSVPSVPAGDVPAEDGPADNGDAQSVESAASAATTSSNCSDAVEVTGTEGESTHNYSFEDEQGPLPYGWVRQWDETDVWYCNTVTGETSWYRPNPDGTARQE